MADESSPKHWRAHPSFPLEEAWPQPDLDGRLEQTATQPGMTFENFWRYLATETVLVRRQDLVATIYLVVAPAGPHGPAGTPAYQWEFMFERHEGAGGRLLTHGRTPKRTTSTT